MADTAQTAKTLQIPSNVVIEDTDYFTEVVNDAATMGILDKLQTMLQQLGSYASGREDLVTRVRLYKDFAPMSFAFVRDRTVPTPYGNEPDWTPWFHGGVIYSGPTPEDGNVSLDGGAPAFCVSLGDPEVGWSVHT